MRRQPDGPAAPVDGDGTPPGHRSLRRKFAVNAGKNLGEVAVVAQAVHGRTDRGVDQPVGCLGHGERDVDRLEEIVADHDLGTGGGIQPAQLRVAAEPAGHLVYAFELRSSISDAVTMAPASVTTSAMVPSARVR